MDKLLKLRAAKIFWGILAALLMGGCQSPGSVNPPVACEVASSRDVATPVEKKLSYAVLSYEEGNYPASIMALQGVLDAASSGKQERVKAYKYLAFIQCVSGREALCRDYFKKALDLDPHFNLDAAEVGHPIWGPVFRSVKSKSAK